MISVSPAPATYDLFVSHAVADEAWVAGYLLDALTAAGLRVLSAATFTLGVPRLLEFERAIQSSRRTLLIITPAYLADDFEQFANLLAQSYGLEQASWPVIPLLLKPTALPPRLAQLVHLEATTPDRWAAAVERLCQTLQVPPPAPPTRPPCPYPGLQPFSTAASHHFYGRDAEIDDLRRRLRHQNYLYVIGPSGSGKSSLVQAGLVPALHRHQPGEWLVVGLRPGAAPVARLAAALAVPSLVPEQAAAAVTDRLAAAAPAVRLLAIIDQLEELFTLAPRDERAAFIALLQALRQSEHCALVLTMRADFYPDLINSTLWPLTAGQRLEIGPLRGEALRTALVEPAGALGVTLEPELVERLLGDAAAEPGALPLLQETMVLLWERLERRFLPLAAYAALGGSGGLTVALATTADAALAHLSGEQQAIARRILLALVQLGEGRADTRRQQTVAALRAAAGGAEPKLFDVTLQHLAGRRLITLTGASEAGTGGANDERRLVDLAHEALIGAWPQLQTWLSDRPGLRLHRQLAEAAAAWQASRSSGRPDESLLYGGARLQAARQFAARATGELSVGEREFLAASAAAVAARQRTRYLGQAAGGAIGAAVGYSLAFGLGLASAPHLSVGAGTVVTAMLATVPVGQLVGLALGLGRWWWRRDPPVVRLAVNTLIGTLTSSVAYLLFVRLTLPAAGQRSPLLDLAVGALFGAGIGIGTGLPGSPRRRLIGTVIGGAVGASLAVMVGGLLWHPLATVVAGLLLGLATAFGFQATAVDDAAAE